MPVRDIIPWRRSENRPSLQSSSEGDVSPFFTLHREMDRLFDSVLRQFGSWPDALRSRLSWPSVEVSDGDKAVIVTAEMPGMDEKDIEVSLDGTILTLRGEKRSEQEDKDRRFSERFYGRFERQIELPTEVKEEGIEASFRNGVLTVTLPKSEAAQSRVKRISVNAAPSTHH